MKLIPYLVFWGVLAAALIALAPRDSNLQRASMQSQTNGGPCKGGPPDYCANSTQNVVQETPMAPPPVNSPFRDPDFGSRMVRVTDANTMAAYGSGYFNNASFMTSASAEANVWGKFDPTLGTRGGYRFVVTGDGAVEVPFMFDPTTMKVKRVTGKSGGFLNSHGRLDLTAPSFGYIHPDILFAANGTQIVAYNFSKDRETRLYDFAGCPNLPAYVSKPWMYTGMVTN